MRLIGAQRTKKPMEFGQQLCAYSASETKFRKFRFANIKNKFYNQIQTTHRIPRFLSFAIFAPLADYRFIIEFFAQEGPFFLLRVRTQIVQFGLFFYSTYCCTHVKACFLPRRMYPQPTYWNKNENNLFIALLSKQLHNSSKYNSIS